MASSRITSIVLVLAVASLSTGCMTNDRYQYTYEKRYKRTSIGRQAPKPLAPETLPLMTAPAPSVAPAPAVTAPEPALPAQ